MLWLNQLILERNPSVLIVNKLSYPDGIPNSSTKELVTKQDIICTTMYLLLLNENASHNHCAVSGKGNPLYCVISALWGFTIIINNDIIHIILSYNYSLHSFLYDCDEPVDHVGVGMKIHVKPLSSCPFQRCQRSGRATWMVGSAGEPRAVSEPRTFF